MLDAGGCVEISAAEPAALQEKEPKAPATATVSVAGNPTVGKDAGMSLYPEPLPYGTWPSPITSDMLVQDAVRLGQIRTHRESVYWIEGRPQEMGRGVLVRWTPGRRPEDITPASYSARTKVHEYGGGDFLACADGVVFSNAIDQRLYWQEKVGTPVTLTDEGPWRYADAILDESRGRILCVVEEEVEGQPEPANYIGMVPFPGGGAPQRFLQGHDFYSNPALNRDGSHLAWLCWDHPNLPWDGTELWVADVDAAGAVSGATLVAGGTSESVFQPQWGPDGHLYFVSDRNGWWNLYRLRDGQVELVFERQAEMGMPQWVFGMSTYAFPTTDLVAVGVHDRGRWRLALVNLADGSVRDVSLPYSDIQAVHAIQGAVILCAASPTKPSSIVHVDVETGTDRVVRRSNRVQLDADLISLPQHVEFPTSDSGTAHGFYYRPTHSNAVGREGERPPLIVKCHGGPTACAQTALDLRVQYWTSRGFGFLDVNYRGSTGFGRAYRAPLDGQWGVIDVQDCVDAARFMVAQGVADKERLIVAGSSAGGYVTLCALTFHDVFKAGASYYGISDLEALLRDTHKFEARYFDRLVGEYPEQQVLYRERSPLHSADKVSCPVIFFQGSDDKVVPPNQAKTMVDALKKRSVPVAYVEFEGEGHGFRQADTIQRAIESELYFYGEVFGLDLPEVLEPVAISNL